MPTKTIAHKIHQTIVPRKIFCSIVTANSDDADTGAIARIVLATD